MADNVAAIAATMAALRAIERHGGHQVMEHVHKGFATLSAPDQPKPWFVIFDCPADEDTAKVRERYRQMRSKMHPDRGGDAEAFALLQEAWASFQTLRGLA